MSKASIIPVKDLRSGDVFTLNGKSFTAFHVTKPRRTKGIHFTYRYPNSRGDVWSQFVSYKEPWSLNYFAEAKDITVLTKDHVTRVEVTVEILSPSKTTGKKELIFNWVENGDSPEITEKINSKNQKENKLDSYFFGDGACSRFVNGQDVVKVTAHNPDVLAVHRARVKKGTPLEDLVSIVLTENGNKPMSELEIRQAIQVLRGKQPTPFSRYQKPGMGPWSLTGNGSMIASGLLTRHGKGSSSKFTLTNHKKFVMKIKLGGVWYPVEASWGHKDAVIVFRRLTKKEK